jgi:hypothetical protein
MALSIHASLGGCWLIDQDELAPSIVIAKGESIAKDFTKWRF